VSAPVMLQATATADPSLLVGLAWAGSVGMALGVAELLLRYRDDPWRTLLHVASIAYIGINVLAATAGCWFVLSNHASLLPAIPTPGIPFVAGIGSMMLLRSRLFSIHTAGEETIPLGFDAVLHALRSSTDRSIDRWRAKERLELACSLLSDLATEDELSNLVAFCEASLRCCQSVGSRDLDSFRKAAQLMQASANVPVDVRAINIGIAFQLTAGSGNLRVVARALREQRGHGLPGESKLGA
jgi:hypothetical protein